MKILLTETQIIKLLKEEYNDVKYGDYVNTLLDKISVGGMEALTPEEQDILDKISKGVDVDKENQQNEPDDEGYEDDYDGYDTNESGDQSDAYYLFMTHFPSKLKVNVNGETWEITQEPVPNENFDILFVTNGTSSFAINPFVKDEFIIEGPFGILKFKVPTVPDDEVTMERFVDEFIRQDIKTVISYVKKKQGK